MNSFFRITIGLLYLLICTNLVAQKEIKTSIILSRIDSVPLAQVHIINLNSNLGVISNNNGEFTIAAQKEDTLSFSIVGFKSLKIRSTDFFKTIYLERQIYSIEQYTVLPYKNFNEFKDAFVKLEIKDTARNKLNTSFVLSVEELRSYEPIASGLVLRGAISAFAAKFNKRIQDKKNYERLVEKDKYQAFLTTKFNPQLIKRITTLEDIILVESFIEYCDFSDEFIQTSTDFDIITKIYECYDEYNSLPIVNY